MGYPTYRKNRGWHDAALRRIRWECLDHMIMFGEARTCAASLASVPPIIMKRGFIDRWTRIPRSIGRLSVSALSHHSLLLGGLHQSDFRYARAILNSP